MRPGRLDRRITLERYTVTQDAAGQELQTWASLGEVWASVRQRSGKEAIQAEQLVASEVVVFTIRYASVTPRDRIKYEGRYYNIQSTRELGRRAGLELIAEGTDHYEAEPN